MKNFRSRFYLPLAVILVLGFPVLSASAQGSLVSIIQNCADWGNDGWCHTTEEVHISMPGGTVTCLSLMCDYSVGDGTWTVSYTATDNTTGLSTDGSVVIKVDMLPPSANIQVPSPTGSNGWFKTKPVVIPFIGYDYGSGLDSVRASSDDGTTWQTWTSSNFTVLDNHSFLIPGLTLSSDGQYVIPYVAEDVSGWSHSYPEVTIKIDSTPPVITPSISGTLGSNGWYTSSVNVIASGSDDTSGLDSAGVTVWSGGAWRPSTLITLDGVYRLNFIATDNAGNFAMVTRTVYIDTKPPAINYTISGTSGSGGWYMSKPVVSAMANDNFGSGVETILISDNGGSGKSSPITLEDGVHNLTIIATDKAGNSQSVSRTVYVDTTGPTISQVSTGLSGKNGWYVSAVDVNATAFDDGSGLQGNVEVSMDSGSNWKALPIQLSDGVYNLTYRVSDKAGNLSISSGSLSVDTTSPSFDILTTGTAGSSGWFVSHTMTSLSARDALAGLENIEYNQNGAGWQSGTSFTSSDGINSASVRAYDKAGNVSTKSMIIKVDTVPPTSLVGNGPSIGVNSGIVKVSGTSSDETSGLQFTEVSVDGGTTWIKTPLSGNGWSLDWDTTSTQNGDHTVLIRSTDAAGNVESSIPFVFTLDNLPPHVKVTDWWWIWESGEYRVSANSFPISTITVDISDPSNLWNHAVINYNPDKTSASIQWDRRFPGDIIAPSGDYTVTVTACDIYGKCASAPGRIKIPFFAYVPPTSTPSSTLTPAVFETSTTSILATMPTALNSATQVIHEPKTPVESILPKKELPKQGNYSHIFHLLWIAVFLSLLIIVATSSLLDHRPKAIRALAQSIQSNTK